MRCCDGRLQVAACTALVITLLTHAVQCGLELELPAWTLHWRHLQGGEGESQVVVVGSSPRRTVSASCVRDDMVVLDGTCLCYHSLKKSRTHEQR
jgi:hypothetical protein